MKEELDILRDKVKSLEEENQQLRSKIDLPDSDSILKRRLHIEKAIFEISSLFIGDYHLNQSFQKSIELLGVLTSADRAYFYRFHHRAKLFHITHEWVNNEIKGLQSSTPSISSEEFNWWTEQLKSRDVIYIPDVSKLPDQAANEKSTLTEQGIKSNVTYPVRIRSKLEGFIGFDHTELDKIWSPEELEIIRIATDIIGFSIERKQSEKSLRKSEKMYQIIYENTGAATLTLKADTTIQMMNSEFEKLIGIPRDQIEKKKKLLELVDKKDQPILQRYHYLLLSNPEAVPKNYEFDYITRDGETRNAYMTGSTLLDTKTCVISFIDITEFKLVEKQLRIAKEKAEESDRLKSAFLANVSHEIRTPLNAITGFSALLSNHNLPLEKKEKYIKQILNGSSELVSLIDNVLDISRIESGTMKTKVAEFLLYAQLEEIRNFYDDFKSQHGKENLEIKLNLPAVHKKFLLKSDQVKLQQILGNLIDNAIKFTASGSVEIGYSVLPNQNKDDSRENILFFVKDTGIGIAKKDKDAIFERFVKIIDKGDYLYRGAGLGLALARDLVHLLGGEIWVESSLGKGSTFYFTIPHIKPKPTTEKIKSAKPIREDFSDKVIMIAEDTESNFLYLKELLHSTKIQIIRAKDGQEAIDIFRKNKDKIDLILMDILMPEYDGFEAAQRIRKINEDVCIIAQTAFTFEGEMENGLYAGCFDDYILKPFDIKIIHKLLHKYLSEKEKG